MKLILVLHILGLLTSCKDVQQNKPEIINQDFYETQGTLRQTIVDGDSPDQSVSLYTVEMPDGQMIDLEKSGISKNILDTLSINQKVILNIENKDFRSINFDNKIGLSTVIVKGIRQLSNSKPVYSLENIDEMDINVALVVTSYKDRKFAREAINDEFIENFKAMIEVSTWGRIKINLSKDDVYEMKNDFNYPGCSGWSGYGNSAIKYIEKVSSKKYFRVITFTPGGSKGNGCGWIGVTNRTSYKDPVSPPIVSISTWPQVAAHEFGHSLGLGHSGLDVGDDAKYTKEDFSARYADYSCLMSNSASNLTMNSVKLLNLNVLNPNHGLKILSQGDNELYSMTIDPDLHQSATAYIYGNLIFSLRQRDLSQKGTDGLEKKYLGVISVHLKNQFADGNVPSSLLVDLIRPGEVWVNPLDKKMKVQFISYSPEQGRAILRVNGKLVDDDDIFNDGCLIFGLDRVEIEHSEFYSQKRFGNVRLDISPSYAGNCRSEDFSFILESRENAPDIDQEIENIHQDLSINEKFVFNLPYANYSGNSKYKTYLISSYQGKIFDERSLSTNVQKCTKGSKGCIIEDKCEVPPTVIFSMNTSNLQANETRNGHILIANNHEDSCPSTKFYLRSVHPKNSAWAHDNFKFDPKLDEVISENSNYQIKEIFLKPGEVVYGSIQATFTNKNINDLLLLQVLDTQNGKTVSQSLRKDSFEQLDILNHHYRPHSIDMFNITGEEKNPTPRPNGANDFIINILYKQFLGRDPDLAGLNYWRSEVRNNDLSKELLFSKFMGPAIKEPQLSKLNNRLFVISMYRKILNRDGDEAGINWWVDQLDHGFDRTHLANSFIFSDEFIRLYERFDLNKE